VTVTSSIDVGDGEIDQTGVKADKPRSGGPSPLKRWMWPLAALAGAWLLPIATNLLGVDWLLPFVILAGTASLLRAGRTALDRLVLAAGLLTGVTAVAGLLISVWPWGLAPVPVAGCALTGLVVLAVLLGRRPSFPRSWGVADSLVVAAGVTCAGVMLWPFRSGGLTNELAMVLHGEDFARHFMIFDAIRRAGGYMFQHSAELGGSVLRPYMTYPQGSHFLFALLDNFARSSTRVGDPLTSLGFLIWCFIGGFIFLCVAVLWAVRWVGGPGLHGWVALPVLALASAVLLTQDPVQLIRNGYPSEIVGLALMVLALALLARPLRRTREQLVVVVGLTVGVAFSYYLWLPLIGLAIAVYLVQHRARVRRHRIVVWATLAAGAAASLVMPLVNERANSGSQLVLGGGVADVNRALLGALLVAALASPVAVRAVRRLPVWRVWLAQVAGALVLLVLLYVYQEATIGQTIYYYEKLLHQLLFLALVGLGSLGVVGQRLLRSEYGPRPAGRPRFAGALGAAVAALAAVWMLAGPVPTRAQTGPGALFIAGDTDDQGGARWVVWAYHNIPPTTQPTFTMVWTSTDMYDNFWATLYLSMLHRDYAKATPGWVYLWPPRTQHFPVEKTEALIAGYQWPVRVVVRSPILLDQLQQYSYAHPELHLQVLDARDFPDAPTKKVTS
jgi:hypothetical protein